MSYNVLLLGGNGFLGKNLVKAFSCDPEIKINVYDISIPDKKYDNVNYFIGNIDNISEIKRIIKEKKINILIHLVSTIVPGASLEDYVRNCKLVQISTIPIIDYCAKNSIRFIFFSSGGTVYGIKGGKVSESETIAPISYYGLSKTQIEDLINFYNRRYNLDYLIIRPSNPYGPGQNIFGRQGLIAVTMGNILKGTPVHIFGNGEIIRDYIFIEDFTYYIKGLLKKNIINETINVGSGSGHSINEILQVFRDISGKNFEVIYENERKDDVPKLILDTTRLHNFINHECIGLREGIKKFYSSIFTN